MVTIEPAATTEPLPTLTPSRTTAFAPIKTLSSITTGLLLGGSKTPAITAPAPTCTFFPILPLAPTTAFMSTIEFSPISAPILITAPIIITAFLPMETPSLIRAPGSILAFIYLVSRRGIAEFLLSDSILYFFIFSLYFFKNFSISVFSPKAI